MTETPPAWIRALNWVFTGIQSLAVVLIIFVQWAGWTILGIAIWNPWGAIVGIVVCAAQMLALFEAGQQRAGACEIPRPE